MTGPVFLGLDEIIEIHHDQIERYGGHPGIRDLGMLKSAVAMPSATFDGNYLHTDIFEMAAAYLFHIVRDMMVGLLETNPLFGLNSSIR